MGLYVSSTPKSNNILFLIIIGDYLLWTTLLEIFQLSQYGFMLY